MAIKTGVSMEEYLRTSFPDLDCEYVDGEIVERSVPNYSHGKVQSNFSAFFVTLRKKNLPLFPGVETRLRVSPTRVCIPDVCVFSPEPAGSGLMDRPLIAIEILSPDDRMAQVLEKLESYRTMEIPHIWLTDPMTRRLYVYTGSLLEVPTLPLPEFGVEVTAADLFD